MLPTMRLPGVFLNVLGTVELIGIEEDDVSEFW